MIVKAGIALAGQIVGLFGAAGKAKAESLKARQEAMQRTWTDEFIVIFWFSPAVIGWFDPAQAQAWIESVFGYSDEYVLILTGITAAVFGLGKLGK